MVDHILASKLIALRKRMGLNQAQFGEVMGCKSGSAVSNWESVRSVPTGARYKQFKVLWAKYMANGHTPPPEPAPLEAQARAEFQRVWELLDEYSRLSSTAKKRFRKLLD